MHKVEHKDVSVTPEKILWDAVLDCDPFCDRSQDPGRCLLIESTGVGTRQVWLLDMDSKALSENSLVPFTRYEEERTTESAATGLSLDTTKRIKVTPVAELCIEIPKNAAVKQSASTLESMFVASLLTIRMMLGPTRPVRMEVAAMSFDMLDVTLLIARYKQTREMEGQGRHIRIRELRGLSPVLSAIGKQYGVFINLTIKVVNEKEYVGYFHGRSRQ